MKRSLLVLSLSCACGVQRYEFLDIERNSETVTFRCPTTETVTMDNSGFTDSPHQISRSCLGLTGACSSEIETLDDTRCSDPTLNLLRGTCVEDFFACFRASGMCMPQSDGVQYSSGARWSGNAGSGLLLPPDSDEPCIIAEGDRYGRVL